MACARPAIQPAASAIATAATSINPSGRAQAIARSGLTTRTSKNARGNCTVLAIRNPRISPGRLSGLCLLKCARCSVTAVVEASPPRSAVYTRPRSCAQKFFEKIADVGNGGDEDHKHPHLARRKERIRPEGAFRQQRVDDQHQGDEGERGIELGLGDGFAQQVLQASLRLQEAAIRMVVAMAMGSPMRRSALAARSARRNVATPASSVVIPPRFSRSS